MSILSTIKSFAGIKSATPDSSGKITTSAQLADFFEGRTGDPAFSPYGNNNVEVVYGRNPVAYQCVNLIAQQLANVDLIVKKGDAEVEDPNHPLVRLLSRPNHTTSGARFFHELTSHLLLFGNAYVVRSKSNSSDAFGLLRRGKGEIRLLNPRFMEVVQNGDPIFPVEYRYSANGDQRRFPVDQITGGCELLHLKTFNPMNPLVGLPAAASAYLAILNHNAGQMWNFKQLENNAVPAAALVLRDGASLTQEQATQMRSDWNRIYGGSAGGGKTAVLAEMDIELLGTDPTKMQYTEGQEAAARNIALAFGVSPMLLGLPGDNTFSNMEGATAGLYQQRVMPLLDYILGEMTVWLNQVFPDLHITYDGDSIAALEAHRREKWQALKDVSFLTVNEKRASLGYEPLEGGDTIPGVNAPAPVVAPPFGRTAATEEEQAEAVNEESTDDANSK